MSTTTTSRTPLGVKLRRARESGVGNQLRPLVYESRPRKYARRPAAGPSASHPTTDRGRRRVAGRPEDGREARAGNVSLVLRPPTSWRCGKAAGSIGPGLNPSDRRAAQCCSCSTMIWNTIRRLRHAGRQAGSMILTTGERLNSISANDVSQCHAMPAICDRRPATTSSA